MSLSTKKFGQDRPEQPLESTTLLRQSTRRRGLLLHISYVCADAVLIGQFAIWLPVTWAQMPCGYMGKVGMFKQVDGGATGYRIYKSDSGVRQGARRAKSLLKSEVDANMLVMDGNAVGRKCSKTTGN
jgi:hypothetical protein